MSFLPKEYQSAANSGGLYLNPSATKDAENNTIKFRLLGKASMTYQRFTDENKPVRTTQLDELKGDKFPDVNAKTGYDNKPQLVVFAPCLDRADGEVKLFSAHQKGILSAIEELSNNEDWGDLTGYDISIKRLDNGGKVSYTVSPIPHKPLDEDALEKLNSLGYDPESYAEGGNAFTNLESSESSSTDIDNVPA